MFAVVRQNSADPVSALRAGTGGHPAKMNAIIAGIMPVLDFIDRNPTLAPVGDLDDRPLPPNPFVERCKAALTNFRAYVHSAACTAAGHALAVVRSLYRAVRLEIIVTGFTNRTSDNDAEKLVEEATESAFKLAEDLDLFGDKEPNNGENQE